MDKVVLNKPLELCLATNTALIFREGAIRQKWSNRSGAVSFGFSLVELVVVISIMLILSSMVSLAVIAIQADARKQEAVAMVVQLHTALETWLLEVPVTALGDSNAEDAGYLSYDDRAGKGVLPNLEKRGLFAFDHARQLDEKQRLVDPWENPWNLVVGIGRDEGGNIPSEICALVDGRWVPVNAGADPLSIIYVYSYGPGDSSGVDYQQWIFNEVDK